jgi:hypothetical protein
LGTVVENNWLGDKTGQGFFKKIKGGAEKEIHTLNLQTLEYAPRSKPKFATLEAAKPIDDLKQRLKALFAGQDKAGEFYRQFHYSLFSYISNRVPEISDEIYRLDDAMKAGFGWEIGAFETWDVLGVAKTVEAMKQSGITVSKWVEDMLEKGITSFYKIENGKRLYYDINSHSYKMIPGGEAFTIMSNNADKIVWKNSACKLYDLGDDVLGLEWYTKMGSIGGEVFHSHLNKNFGIPSIHSKMCNSFPGDWSKAEPAQIETINSIRKCLTGTKMQYSAVANEKNRVGSGDGILIGGNLSILHNLAGTKSDINTAGKILFVEDTGEYLYSIDRMFWNLKRTGKLDKLSGLIIGGMKAKPDDAGEEFGRTVIDIVTEVVNEFKYPVCFDFPVGHQKNNYALKCGINHKLIISIDSVTLSEVPKV